MCGIAGAFGLDGPLDPGVCRAGDRMTDALRHRGPDARGVYRDPRVVLGHRRLAIIDLAQGAQPMATPDGGCHVVFNGEIYNHRSLRRALEQRGHRFRTRSDTEVILQAYEAFGAECVDHLEGMFAFALYDGRTETLLLARDRLGKKPLYYFVLGGVLHFASEIKALAESPLWDPALDLAALESYFALGYVLAPGTMYRHVRMLEPAHVLEAAGGRTACWRYWRIADLDTDTRPAEAIVEELDALLRRQVGDRLESEVPLGAFLSGGIDSGLVVSHMAEGMDRPVETTAVGFGDARHNELDAAALTAAHCRTRHHAEVAAPDLHEILDPIVSAFDQPFADSSAIPTYYVSAMARRHVTVALSGDGGDEVFGGYDFRYVPHALEDRARGLVPGRLGRSAVRWLASRWPRSPRLPKPLRLATILDNLGVDAATAYFHDLCFLKPPRVARLLGRDPDAAGGSALREVVTGVYNACPSPSAVQRAQYADLHLYLPNDVLVKVDRMSMQHGLEVRSPLLDREVVEFGFRIPTTTKMPGLESKALLRRLAARRLPPALLTLPKHGFTAPVGRWIAGPHAAQFRDEVLGPQAFLGTVADRAVVAAALDDHQAGRADHSYLLWAAWVLERWGRRQRGA